MGRTILEQGSGILRLTPTWVHRGLNPGKRIKLHPADFFAYGQNRGAIIERWLSSTTKAENGPLTTAYKGLSFVVYGEETNPQKVLLRDLVADLGADLLGDALWNKYHAWPAFSKFFDNKGALPFHMHHRAEHAALMGAQPKPESYYYPLFGLIIYMLLEWYMGLRFGGIMAMRNFGYFHDCHLVRPSSRPGKCARPDR